MYCRHCGNEMADIAAICVKCGVAARQGSQYCYHCGRPTAPGAVYCTGCGVALNQPSGGIFGNRPGAVPGQKSRLIAGLLGVFLGGLGVHNFYLGNNSRAILQIVLTCFTLSLAGLWGFIEGILILVGQINTDASGMPLGE